MYTDTKNLQNREMANNFVITAPMHTVVNSRRGKLSRIWRPLRRLITLKSTTAKCGHNAGESHPNNVHLNNVVNTTSKEACDLFATLSDDCQTVETKMSPFEANSIPDDTQPCRPLQYEEKYVISSASIMKASTPTCSDCIYGANCQHEPCQSNCLPLPHQSTVAALSRHEPELDAVTVHLLRSNDDLLNAWLLHDWQQMSQWTE